YYLKIGKLGITMKTAGRFASPGKGLYKTAAFPFYRGVLEWRQNIFLTDVIYCYGNFEKI
ncbi:MAG: hypothetical protein ACPL7I_04490, partial [Myxococcota bacterium]